MWRYSEEFNERKGAKNKQVDTPFLTHNTITFDEIKMLLDISNRSVSYYIKDLRKLGYNIRRKTIITCWLKTITKKECFLATLI